MSAPEYVPTDPRSRPRVYRSPKWRSADWRPRRPGEVSGLNPRGDGFGCVGPDQGYVLRLANTLRERVRLIEGEQWEDVRAGCCQIALRRAAAHGRAPVLEDVEVALGLWGFLSDEVPHDLLLIRKRVFDVISHPHHEHRLRALDEKVAESALRLGSAEISTRLWDEWRDWILADDQRLGSVGESTESPDTRVASGATTSPMGAPVKKVVKKVVKRVVRKAASDRDEKS